MITAVRNGKYVTRNALLFKTLIVDSFVDKGGNKYEDEDISDVMILQRSKMKILLKII